jgi:hypothetical protein
MGDPLRLSGYPTVSRRHAYRSELRAGMEYLTLRVTHRPSPYRMEDHYACHRVSHGLPTTCISVQISGWHITKEHRCHPLKITPL